MGNQDSIMNKFLIVFLILLLSIIISCTPQNGENTLDKENNSNARLDENKIIGDWKGPILRKYL
jgi:hypothetical protein